jgi:putative FmdB family regulatory protein
MPTYEYACRDCGQHLEVVQSFTEEPLRVCGACGGALRKVFSAAGIIFKGSGYYVTDSRKSGGDAGAGSSTKTTETPSSDSSTSSTSTASTTTEAKSA